MKKLVVIGCLLSLFLPFAHHHAHAQAEPLSDSLFLKVTIVENGVEYQWEYSNPDEYEYEHGNKIVKGDQGRRLVSKMFTYLNISPGAEVKDMVAKLKKDGHEQIDCLDVRWINSEEKLYTWAWKAKNEK
ncbi:MAG TPA: hypothetical protein VFK44_00295 [Bacillales bacterium]|nr:hypothetical protein [Bacillales bacterium]